MNWYLVIYLLSTDDVLVRGFKTQATCETYLINHKDEIMHDKDVKKIQCEKNPGMDMMLNPKNKDIET